MTELTKEQHGQIEVLRKLAFDMPPAFQYRLACFVAENVGYVLGPDPLRGGPDEARDHAPEPLMRKFAMDLADRTSAEVAAALAPSTASSDVAGQLFVVDGLDTKSGKVNAVYVFNNHEAALECRRYLGLDHDHLRGCVVFSTWKDGQPHRTTSPTPSDAMTDGALVTEDDGTGDVIYPTQTGAGAVYTATPPQADDAERNNLFQIAVLKREISAYKEDVIKAERRTRASEKALLALTTRPSPTPAAVEAWQDIAQEARFLLDRLEELDDANDVEYIREFEGHVRPPMSRLRRLLPRDDRGESNG
jgi:hypothetical protein